MGTITPARLAMDATGVVHLLDLTGYWQFRASDGALLAKVDVEPSLREHGITMVNQIDFSETHLFAAGSYGTLFSMNPATGEIARTHALRGEGRFGNYPITIENALWHSTPRRICSEPEQQYPAGFDARSRLPRARISLSLLFTWQRSA